MYQIGDGRTICYKAYFTQCQAPSVECHYSLKVTLFLANHILHIVDTDSRVRKSFFAFASFNQDRFDEMIFISYCNMRKSACKLGINKLKQIPVKISTMNQ
jgi:hypothetical protein